MALVILQEGFQPLGQFDGYAPDSTSTAPSVRPWQGGEIAQFVSVAKSSQGLAADSQDGYVNAGTGNNIMVVTKELAAFGAADGYNLQKPIFLADEGTTYYGTLLGALVGGTVGQQANGYLTTPTGPVFGPATEIGSGRITCWDKPGLYGVTLDTVDQGATLGTTGVVPSNADLNGGAPLYATKASGYSTGSSPGWLTLLASNSPDYFAADGATVVAWFVEFRSNGSLVTTPNRLVSALNSPSSVVGGVLPLNLYMAVIHFAPNG